MITDIHLKIEGSSDARSRIVGELLRHPGIDQASLQGDKLSLVYDLPATNAKALVELLENAGLSLVLTWFQRFTFNLRCYRESVFCEEANNDIGWDSCVREIYVSRYRHRRHGRRDDRPRHWRQYPTMRK